MDPPAPKPTRPACNSLLADLQLQVKRVEWTLDSGVVGVGCVSPLRSDDSANATVNATGLHMAARLSGSIGVKSPVAHGGRMPQREVVRQSARGGGRSGKGTVTSLSAAVTQTMRAPGGGARSIRGGARSIRNIDLHQMAWYATICHLDRESTHCSAMTWEMSLESDL